MEIYLLRHGSAERAAAGAPDSERSLSEEGRHEVRRVISAAKLAGVCPSLVLASPYKRARQTAKIVADVLDLKEPVVPSDALIPNADPRAVWDEIRVHQDRTSLLLAGHEPLFSACTAYLLSCPELQVDFPKAGLVRIDFDSFGTGPRGVLRWLLTPHLTV